MNADRLHYVEELIQRYPNLETVKKEICAVYHCLENCYENGGKLLVAGNGGSAADAEHIVSELMKGFKQPRAIKAEDREKLMQTDPENGAFLARQLQGALPAIAVTGHSALTTAYMNDCDPYLCFAQQVYGLGNTGDVLLCISTSGNSKNVLYAAAVAKAKGMHVIGLTGAAENRLQVLSDYCICVPQTETYKVQELHLPVYHCLCMMLEQRFFGTESAQDR